VSRAERRRLHPRLEQVKGVLLYAQKMFQYSVRYTGVVNPKATIGKPCNGQRNVDNCMHGRKTENEKNIK